MEKETRTAIERATQRARRLLEEDFTSQLESTFDVLPSGAVAVAPGAHLMAREAKQRERIVAAIAHKRAAGMTAAEAVADYVRDAAFTALNRFAALKMLEARGLVQECVSKGEQSSGYREFCGRAPGVALLPAAAGYRLYVESLFDELSTEIKVLFDRRDPASVLWPRRATFADLLDAFNASDLAGVWTDDETIGWVYQYFNSGDERRTMREASQAPRNSRELAVRNQFFTPRYVVEFLVDNTLGRTWLEMHGRASRLAEQCRYFVRTEDDEKRTRPRKDPRDLRVLDPACGSGHFLLYAFDLLLTIYEEAWAAEEAAPSEATGRALREDYAELDGLRRAVPALIVEHNLHGVDIDPRAAQIAALALWLRAQRAWKDLGVPAPQRPRITRTHIVVAEPMPGDEVLVEEFAARLDPPLLRDLFRKMVAEMRLAGELGTLLPVEQSLAGELTRAREHFVKQRLVPEAEFLPGMERPSPAQGALDLSGIDDDRFFHEAETRLLDALREFAEGAAGGASVRRRLFAGDAAQGIALLDLLRRRFDVVLMNPPFGEFISVRFEALARLYPSSKRDLGFAFLERGCSICPEGGLVGALVSRKPFFVDTQGVWRQYFAGHHYFAAFADLGHRVLDDALVEVAAVAIGTGVLPSVFLDCLDAERKSDALQSAVQGSDGRLFRRHLSEFEALPSCQFAYRVSPDALRVFGACPPYEPTSGVVRMGLTTSDNERFLRLWWELDRRRLGRQGWSPVVKGGEYAPFFAGFELLVNWQDGRGEMAAYNLSVGNEAQSRRGSINYFQPALTYTERTASRFSARLLPAGAIFSGAGPAILPTSAGDLLDQLAVFNSWCFFVLHEVCLGGGDAVSSGAAARHYTSGLLGKMPFPSSLSAVRSCRTDTEILFRAAMSLVAANDSSPYHRSVLGRLSDYGSFDEYVAACVAERLALATSAVEASGRIEQAVAKDYGLDLVGIRETGKHLVGPHPDWLSRAPLAEEEQEVRHLVRNLISLMPDALVDKVTELCGNARFLALKSYCIDRQLELISHAVGRHPTTVAALILDEGLVPQGLQEELFQSIVAEVLAATWQVDEDSASTNTKSDLMSAQQVLDERHWVRLFPSREGGATVLVDDPGHSHDVVSLFSSKLGTLVSDQFERELADRVAGDDWRRFFSDNFFDRHLAQTSMHRRTAPVFWQLSVASRRYSLWLFSGAVSRDTMFEALNDFVVPRLAREEARVERLRGVPAQNSAARRELASSEALVEELRAMLDEIKRVAPLWNPDLDDGIVLVMAPLWRLVPQHKTWQKELKSKWDELVAGKYDWAHLAMHLWPERVVPKCATDRSLAIAHGLEDEFWVEGADGKWKARTTPKRPVEELVRERSSPAVKAALKSLLEAPAPGGVMKRPRKA